MRRYLKCTDEVQCVDLQGAPSTNVEAVTLTQAVGERDLVSVTGCIDRIEYIRLRNLAGVHEVIAHGRSVLVVDICRATEAIPKVKLNVGVGLPE